MIGLVLLVLCLGGCGKIIPHTDSPETSTLTVTPPHKFTCEAPYIAEGFPSEAHNWAVEIIENIQPGTTGQSEVVELLGVPTEELDRNRVLYESGFEGVELVVVYNADGIVQDIGLVNPMTLGQLVETYGSPSRVFREVDDIAIAYEYPHMLGVTLLHYEEPHMEVGVLQGLCEFPSGIVINVISVVGPTENLRTLFSPAAVEIEWPGLADD
jgi:hypothetical protein